MAELPECDKEVREKGEHIATIDLKANTIEEIVKSAAKSSGQKMDWFFAGGRGVVFAMGDLNTARKYLQEELKPYKEGYYRFTTDKDSLLPLPPI